jgi:hypothetical protein
MVFCSALSFIMITYVCYKVWNSSAPLTSLTCQAMLATILLLGLPFCTAESASSYAGSTVVDSYPPPGATNTAVDTYFPDASQVGYAGPTPSQ